MNPRPSPTRITLALTGLAAVGASLWVAFQQPYSAWPWVLLMIALACALASRRA
ncbi:MAG: hypothetical protein AB4911_13940 [Oscillochloridaceae bacterium umkhey_bin13]